MDNRLRQKIYTGFFIASILISLISFFYYKSTEDFIRSSVAVQLSTLELRQQERVLSLLKDAETGERGYIITRKEPFLEPYFAATRGLNSEVKALKQLTADDPFYQQIYPRLDSLIKEEVTFLDNNIRLAKQGKTDEVTSRVVSGQGKKLLDAIRVTINHMQQHEENELFVLQQEAERDVFINYLVNYLGIALTVILFAIGFWVIVSDLTRREKLEKALVDKNEQLGTLNEELEAALEEANTANDKIKEYLQILEEKNNALNDLNHELETFSYTISHDLQSPLRTIAGYASMLSQLPEVASNNEITRQVGIIEKNALRMDALINDLLKFARLGKTAVNKTLTDMNVILTHVITQIQEHKDLTKFTFRLGNLRQVPADKKLIQQVWANLISNAIKFSAPVEKPVIETGCEARDENILFYIKDNGIGFDPAQEDPFGVFKRLHRGEKFEGNGIGLAIVQRIIKHHGGEVWAESAHAKGASFFFTLPI